MQICPSLLVKKDRGRPVDPQARPRAYGEVTVVSDVPGVELLQHDVEDDSGDSDGSDKSGFIDSDNDEDNNEDTAVSSDEENQLSSDFSGSEDEDDEDEKEDEESDSGINDDEEDAEENEELEETDGFYIDHESNSAESKTAVKDTKSRKRKCSDFDGQLIAAETSLRALKRLAEVKMGNTTSDTDGILSNEDFQRIKELKVKYFAN